MIAIFIATEIVNIVRSLSMLVPILSLSPSWCIHVEIKGCTRNPIMESEFHVEQFYLGPFSAFSGETLSIS
jgi:hypothetical protein